MLEEKYKDAYDKRGEEEWRREWKEDMGKYLRQDEFFVTFYVGNTHALVFEDEDTVARKDPHKWTYFVRTAGWSIIKEVLIHLVRHALSFHPLYRQHAVIL
jgi:hypothetical protein